MLTEDHHIKVMDFGLATRLPMDGIDEPMPGRITSADAGILRGTPAYMAPGKFAARRQTAGPTSSRSAPSTSCCPA